VYRSTYNVQRNQLALQQLLFTVRVCDGGVVIMVLKMSDKKTLKTERLTIKSVAADAGVSVAAVSKVMRNAYGVSDSLRENVMESIERLGYRPSTAARGMRGKTYTVGILIGDMSNPFLPELIEGANDALGAENFKALIGVGQGRRKIESSMIESMIDNRMDGLILVAPRLSGALLAGFARQIPLVAIGHHEPSAQTFDTMNSDDKRGGLLAGEALLAKGYETIEMFSLTDKVGGQCDPFFPREQGFEAAMEAAGRAVKINRLREAAGDLDSDLSAFLDRTDLPRAVFCWSDLHAIALMNMAKERGLRVPEDLAVVGYDNNPVARLPLIGLASIDQNGRDLGKRAAETLLSRIGGRTAIEHATLAPTLVKRSSLG